MFLKYRHISRGLFLASQDYLHQYIIATDYLYYICNENYSGREFLFLFLFASSPQFLFAKRYGDLHAKYSLAAREHVCVSQMHANSITVRTHLQVFTRLYGRHDAEYLF